MICQATPDLPRNYVDSETCGLHSIMVLLQWATEEGDIHLHHVWYEKVGDTLDLIEKLAAGTVVGFNLVFDWYHLVKIHTIWSLLPRDWIPIDHIEEIAQREAEGQAGLCLKPASCLDLLLHSRKGPYQSLMAREDVRIRRVPTALAYALAEELEKLIQIDGIYFARSADKDAPRWHVYDVRNRDGEIDEHFKDVCLRFNPAGGLKFLAEHALGYEPKFHFKDVEPSSRPIELGYAPTALMVSTPEEGWAVYGKPDKDGNPTIKGYAWPALVKAHAEHWKNNANAQEYATDDIVYTRALCHHFGDPTPDDDDSVLACMVPSIRWRGFTIDVEGIKELLEGAQSVMDTSPININKPAEVRRYIGECMCDTEFLIIDESTKKAKLISVSNWKLDFNDVEEDDTGAEDLQGWRINHAEECEKCDSSGTYQCKKCPRCEGTGKMQPGLHPASKRAAEILGIKAAAKEVELYTKLLKAGKFHASFNIIGALSSRMSGGDGLNAQGIKHDKEVRRMFPLSWVGYQLSGGDFDSFEVTIAEKVYEDEGITKIILSGKKVHAYFAMCMYPGVTYEEVLASEGTDFDMYTKGKSGFFGILYFGNWSTLVRNFGISKEDAMSAEAAFFEKYPGIPKARKRIEGMFGSMKQPDGIGSAVIWHDPADCMKSLLGFPRYFTLENTICRALFDLARKPPKHWKECSAKVVRRNRIQSAGGATASAIYGAAFQIQAANTRQAGNHEIQSTGAQITKALQRRIWDLQPAGVHEFLVAPMNVHDEIMCVNKPEMADAVAAVVVKVVESYRETIPLIGMTWFKKMATWAGKKGGDVEGEVKVQSPRMQSSDPASPSPSPPRNLANLASSVVHSEPSQT